MWQSNFTQWLTYQAFESTPWRESILVQPMWQGIFNHQLPYQSFVNAHCWETISMQPLWQGLYRQWRTCQTFTNTHYIGRNHINTVNVTRPFHRNFILFVMEKPYFCLKFTFLLTNCISLLIHEITLLFVLNSHYN